MTQPATTHRPKIVSFFIFIGILSLGQLYFQFNLKDELLNNYENSKLKTPFAPSVNIPTVTPKKRANAALPEPAIKDCFKTDFINQKHLADRLHVVSTFYLSGKKQGVPAWEIEQSALLAGVSIAEFRNAAFNNAPHRTGLFKKSNRLANITQPMPSLPAEATDEHTPDNLARHMATALSQAGANRNIADETLLIRYLGLKKYTAAAEQIKQSATIPLILEELDPISAAMMLNPDIDFDDLHTLHQAGVPYTLTALSQLADLPDGTSLAQHILPYVKDTPLSTHWKSGYYVVNLLTDALQQGNTLMAAFWYNVGVPAQPLTHEINALDAFPKPIEHAEQHAERLFLQQLLADGLQPYLPSTEANIQQWFKNDAQYLNDHALLPSWFDAINTAASTSIDKLENYLQRVEAAPHTNTLSETAFEQCKTNDHFLRARQSLIDASGMRDGFALMPVERKLNLLATTDVPFWIVPLMNDTFIEAFQDFWLPLNDKNTGPDTAPDSVEVKQKQRISAAIRSYKSVEDIKTLLAQGYPLAEDTIHVIARSGRVELIEVLENYGLDIYALTPQGNNALHSALQGFKPYQTYQYLANEKHLPLQNTSQLLLRAMQLNPYDPQTVSLVKQLVDSGIKVQKIHWSALVYHVRPNSQTYLQLLHIFKQAQ